MKEIIKLQDQYIYLLSKNLSEAFVNGYEASDEDIQKESELVDEISKLVKQNKI